MTPLYGRVSNQESMPCIWNWCSWSTTWFPSVDNAPVNAPSSAACRLASEPALQSAGVAAQPLAFVPLRGGSIYSFTCFATSKPTSQSPLLGVTLKNVGLQAVNEPGCQAALAGSVPAPPVHSFQFLVCDWPMEHARTGLQLNSEQ